MSQKTFSTGAAVADFDLDGDLDLVINNLDASPYFYKNELSDNRSIRLSLIDKHERPVTQGVRVQLYSDGQSQPRVADVRVNRGFYSASETTVHFGLGQSTSMDSIRVYWSPDEYSVHTGLQPNRMNTIKHPGATIKRSARTLHRTKSDAPDLGVAVSHTMSSDDDYAHQVLLPFEIGVDDRPFAVADFTGDGLEDIIIGPDAEDGAALFVQGASGTFIQRAIAARQLRGQHATYIAVGDLDGDQDMDAYLTIGGNAHKPSSEAYANYVMINDGRGAFSISRDRTHQPSSDSHADLSDVDGDGDLDIIVYGRHQPWSYPYPADSYILLNESRAGQIDFVDATADLSPEMRELGLVTTSAWTDVDADPELELIVAGDWMPITIFDKKDNVYQKRTLSNTTGWWRSIEVLDYNNDGINDLIVGNIGDNAKYKTSADKQFNVYFDDMDDNGQSDIVLTYEKSDKEYPVRGRSCSSEQMPELAEQIPTFDQFASLSIEGVYGDRLDKANKLSADDFSTVLLTGRGDGTFDISDMPKELQIAPANVIHQISDDSYLMAGGMRYMEVETPNIDASYGQGFAIADDGTVQLEDVDLGSLMVGQVENIQQIKVGNSTYLIWWPIGGEMIMTRVPQIEE